MQPNLFELETDSRRLSKKERHAVYLILRHVLKNEPMPTTFDVLDAAMDALDKFKPRRRRRRKS